MTDNNNGTRPSTSVPIPASSSSGTAMDRNLSNTSSTATTKGRDGGKEPSLSTTPTPSHVLGAGGTLKGLTSATQSSTNPTGAASPNLARIDTARSGFLAGSGPSATASVETSPAQDRIQSAPAGQHQHRDRDASSTVASTIGDLEAGQPGTIGRGAPPRSAGYAAQRTSSVAPASSAGNHLRNQNPSTSTSGGRDSAAWQRSLSVTGGGGAPSDLDSLSARGGGASASEFDSGDEDETRGSLVYPSTSSGAGQIPTAVGYTTSGPRSAGGTGTGRRAAPTSVAGSARGSISATSTTRRGSAATAVPGGSALSGTRSQSSQAGVGKRARSKTSAKTLVDEDDDLLDSEGNTISVSAGGGAVGLADRYGPMDDEDDEVQVRDRGQELVLKRARERQREKALKRKQAQREEKRRMSQVQQSSLPPTSPRMEPMSPGGVTGAGLEREGRPVQISIPSVPRSEVLASQAGGGQPLSPSTSQMSPGASIATMRSTSATTPSATSMNTAPSYGLGGTNVYPSPHGHIRRPVSSQNVGGGVARRHSGMSGTSSAVPATGAGLAPAATTHNDLFSEDGRTHSEIRSVTTGLGPESTIGADDMTGYEREEDEEDYGDEQRDAVTGLVRDRVARQGGEDGVAERDEGLEEEEEDGSPSPGSGEEIDPDDVEYTLKDRQDAINIEHPFGLPIWKPALYKKSRSVTRNAETALHSMPSAAAERHLLPGNILWTVCFGSWLSLVCFATSIALNFIPYGGSRYARVCWELGGYIFWPFGKYVEVELSPFSGQRESFMPPSEADFGGDGGVQGENEEEGESREVIPRSGSYENDFTPVIARYPHDHTHQIAFNSRPISAFGDNASAAADQQGSGPSGSNGGRRGPSEGESNASSQTQTQSINVSSEATPLKDGAARKSVNYGSIGDDNTAVASADDEDDKTRVARELGVYGYVFDEQGREIGRAERFLGRVAYGIVFWLVIAPLMGLVCLFCWGGVFTIPMAKLSWVLLKNLSSQPLALHFRSALIKNRDNSKGAAERLLAPLRPGQLAPRSKSFTGTGAQRRSKILLCTYRAVGGQYYKYTVGGVNILFVNTLPIVFFTIIDFFFLEPYVEHHGIHSGLLALVSSKGILFLLALLSVIPLSYFIGMAVASISAQSSIGMGAVINATFGSIIEIILYSIALTQGKAKLVEGSIIGSILAGVLLMPGLSMCSGATRRKEQRFNARSAGVTSTMLIMAIIGILTPTLFYQIYGTFQLTCDGCPTDGAAGDAWTCKRCFYEHVPPATDPFFQSNVKGLMYTCTVILVLSYAIGLWFSLRTHASQIWQNPTPAHQQHPTTNANTMHTTTGTAPMTSIPSAQRASIYKRMMPASVYQQLLPSHRPQSQTSQSNSAKGTAGRRVSSTEGAELPQLDLPASYTEEDLSRAFALTASAFHNAMQEQQRQQQHQNQQQSANQAMPRSAAPRQSVHETDDDDGGHGGHDAPSWSRQTSVSVLLGCTVLYAIIAEILVDVVDVVLDGSGIDEKFLGISLFALVPNTTEFMNAMSFAINGNIALSMEIGSAYALQVCLIQIPAMVAFSAYYNATHNFPGSDVLLRTFTLIFPRWDVIAIIFSVFLLTYTYIEARSNYYRGSICILSYCVLIAGFYYAPASGDMEMPPDTPNLMQTFRVVGDALGAAAAPLANDAHAAFGGLKTFAPTPVLHGAAWLYAVIASLWSR